MSKTWSGHFCCFRLSVISFMFEVSCLVAKGEKSRYEDIRYPSRPNMFTASLARANLSPSAGLIQNSELRNESSTSGKSFVTALCLLRSDLLLSELREERRKTNLPRHTCSSVKEVTNTA